MNNNSESFIKSELLKLLVQESRREDEDLLLIGVELLSHSTRSTIWDMCKYFAINNGVEGNSSRIFEQYVASYVRWLMWHTGIEDADQVIQIVGPQLPLIVACCFQLATKSLSARADITHESVRQYLRTTTNTDYSISRIHEMEIEIFQRIGYRLPIYTCSDSAKTLAAEFKLPPPTLVRINVLVAASEASRSLIENAMHHLYDTRHTPTRRYARIKTLHLAASCVVAASQCDLGLSVAMLLAGRLERLLGVATAYTRTLANVILAETAGQPPHYLFNFGLANPYENIL